MTTKELPTLSRSREPCSTSRLQRSDFVQETILGGKPVFCYDLLRMEKHVFVKICHVFREKGFLADSRHITVEEQMVMFLLTVAHNNQNKVVQDQFQYSSEIVHRFFLVVLNAFQKFAMEIIVPPSFENTPKEIAQHLEYHTCFKGAVGAIDGILINAVIPTAEQVRYIGRNGEIAQNVMAACSFDMLFTYYIVGWEGSAHDSRILMEAITDPKNKFPIPPPGKYYLVDSDYPNMPGFLAPYRSVRYCLREYKYRCPRNRKEFFNYAHSSLRNVIERAFKVLNARFPILKRMPPYSYLVQINIVIACMALHNFIRKESITDPWFNSFTLEDETESDDDPEEALVAPLQEKQEMGAFRDEIVDALYHSLNE